MANDREAPERIWLQRIRDGEMDGWTWCAEQIGADDVAYVRADLAQADKDREVKRLTRMYREARDEMIALASDPKRPASPLPPPGSAGEAEMVNRFISAFRAARVANRNLPPREYMTDSELDRLSQRRAVEAALRAAFGGSGAAGEGSGDA